MAYAPAPLVRESLKPPPWNVEQAFVDPAFQNLWLGLLDVFPLFVGHDDGIGRFGRDGVRGGTSTPGWSPSSLGPALDVSTDQRVLVDTAYNTGASRMTAAAVATPRSRNDFGIWAISGRQGGANDRKTWIIGFDGSAPQKLRCQLSDGSNVTNLTEGTASSLDEPHVVLFTYDDPDVVFYVDGLEVATGSRAGPLATLTAGHNQFSFGDGEHQQTGWGTDPLDGLIHLVAIWDRPLSSAEVRAFSADPFGLIRPNWDYLTAVGATFPAAPTNLTATAVSTSQIDLSWDAVSGAGGYDIERDGVVIVSDQAGTTFSDTGLNTGQSYDYRVRAVS